MARKAAVISIDVNAGTAKMLVDLEKGKAGLRSFGSEGAGSMRQFGEAGVSEHRAVSAAMKTVEGNFLNNKRAADAFLTTIPGIGKALQAAFPIVGAVAFAGIIGEVGKKVYDFFKQMSEGPEKMEGTFRKAGDALRTTDDELLVSNARLENEIAKLEGKPENQLKLAVEETALAFDKLADSIDRMLSGSYKALSETKIGEFDDIIHFMMGVHKDVDISSLIGGATGLGGMSAAIAKIKADADKTIDAIRTPPSTAAPARFGVAPPPNAGIAAGLPEFHITGGGIPEPRPIEGLVGQFKIAGTNPLEQEKEAIRKAYTEILKIQQDGYDKLKTEFDRVSKLGGIKSPEYLEALQFGQQQLQAQMKVTRDTIANASLVEKKGGAQEDSEKRKTAAAQAKIDQAELLRLSKELERAQDARLAGLEKINAEETDEYRNINLNENLSLAAKAKMAPLVAQIYDAKRLATYSEEMDKYDKLIKQASDHWAVLGKEAHKAGESLYSEEIKEGKKLIEEHAKAIEKLCQEYNKLTDAAAKQALAHKVSMIGLEPGASADPLGTLARRQAVERQDIEDRYQNSLKLANSDLERANLLRERNLELQRLQNEMEQRTAEIRQKGIKDFFLEMQGQAKTAGNVIYDALNSTLDRVSDQFAKLFTGQKTSFGKMFQGVGEEMVKESVKSAMQKGLGELGKKVFHIDPAAAGKPDGTKAKPYHVVMDGKQASKPGSPGEDDSSQDDSTDTGKNPLSSLGGLIKSGAGAFVGLLGKLFSGGGGGGGESVSGSISYRAEGGDVDPGHGYIVGDGGEPEFFKPRTAGTITPMHKMGGGSYTYHIDARGADLGAANRTARAIEAAHNAAVRNSVRAQAERTKRTPQRRTS